MSPKTTRRRIPARLAIASLALAVGTITGCIEEDQLSAAIDEVSMKLESLGAPGTAIPGEQLRQKTYTEAVSTLKPLVNDGNADQKSTAWLLIARAELGLAADPAADAAEARRQAAEAFRGIRAELTAYREVAALAAAAESFDPVAEIAELQEHIADRAEAAKQVEAELAEVRQQIADLEALEAKARTTAEAHRTTEANLRSQAMSMSAQDALPIVKQAAEQRSLADDLAAKADRLAAEADVLRPRITEFEGEIDRFAQQQVLLEGSIQSLIDQREATAAEVTSLRARAAEIAARLTRAVADADAYRAGPLTETHDAAIQALEGARASASKATANRTASRLASAEISHTLGGTAAAHAATLTRMLAVIAEARDEAGIQDASLASAASATRAQAEAARDKAEEALRAARDDYQNAGVRGDASDRIDAIVTSINDILGEEPEQPGEPMGETDQGETAPADAAEPDTDDAEEPAE